MSMTFLSGFKPQWLWFAVPVVLGLVGLLFGEPILLVPTLVFLAVLAADYIWPDLAVHRLAGRCVIAPIRTFLGDAVTARFIIQRVQRFPQFWVEVRTSLSSAFEILDGVSIPSPQLGRQAMRRWLALGRRDQVIWNQRLRCLRRGIYTIGPTQVVVGNPLRLLTRARARTIPPIKITVYPLVATLPDLHLPALYPFGQLPTSRRLVDDPLRMAGIRAYDPGDDPRRIHWKATARTGELRSKVLDPSGQYRFMIVLDVNADGEQRRGVDSDILELAITATASLALWAMEEGYATGLLANAAIPPLETEEIKEDEPTPDEVSTRSLLWLAPNGRQQQRERVLGALARITPEFGVPIEGLIDLHRREIVEGTTIIVVSAVYALRQETIDYLMELRRHGVAVHLVLTSLPGSRFPADIYDLPVHYIGGREVWHALLTRAHQRGNQTRDVPVLRVV